MVGVTAPPSSTGLSMCYPARDGSGPSLALFCFPARAPRPSKASLSVLRGSCSNSGNSDTSTGCGLPRASLPLRYNLPSRYLYHGTCTIRIHVLMCSSCIHARSMSIVVILQIHFKCKVHGRTLNWNDHSKTLN